MCQHVLQKFISSVASQNQTTSSSLAPQHHHWSGHVAQPLSTFDIQTHCLFCDKCWQLGPDSRHRERWKRAIIRRTAEQEGKHDFKQAIRDVCNHQNDAQARDVRIRIQGAISYMQAADAIYHKECYTLFIASRTISAADNKSSCSSNKSAFQMVVDVIGWKPSHIWNSVDVYNLYSHKGSCLLRRPLTTKLAQQFGNDLLVLSGRVVANVLVVRSKASSVLRLVDDDEDYVSASVEILAKQIIRECRELWKVLPDSIKSWWGQCKLESNSSITTEISVHLIACIDVRCIHSQYCY